MKRISPRAVRSPAKTGAAKITIQKFYLPDGSSTQLGASSRTSSCPRSTSTCPSASPTCPTP